jgi:hypothetical protein
MFAFRKGFLSFSTHRKGLELSNSTCDKHFEESKKRSIVTKRVPYGELFRLAELPLTHRLTHDAESFASRRVRFSAVSGTTCDERPRGESFLFEGGHQRPQLPMAPRPRKLSRSPICRSPWINNTRTLPLNLFSPQLSLPNAKAGLRVSAENGPPAAAERRRKRRPVTRCSALFAVAISRLGRAHNWRIGCSGPSSKMPARLRWCGTQLPLLQ